MQKLGIATYFASDEFMYITKQTVPELMFDWKLGTCVYIRLKQVGLLPTNRKFLFGQYLQSKTNLNREDKE